MKLYTEDDVLHMLRSFHNMEMNVQLCMLKLTPIELPSDEEIHKQATMNKVQSFHDACTTEDCPHCAYEKQQEYEAELEKEAAIDFAKWLLVQNIHYHDNTSEGNVYNYNGNIVTMEQLYQLYLKSA